MGRGRDRMRSPRWSRSRSRDRHSSYSSHDFRRERGRDGRRRSRSRSRSRNRLSNRSSFHKLKCSPNERTDKSSGWRGRSWKGRGSGSFHKDNLENNNKVWNGPTWDQVASSSRNEETTVLDKERPWSPWENAKKSSNKPKSWLSWEEAKEKSLPPLEVAQSPSSKSKATSEGYFSVKTTTEPHVRIADDVDTNRKLTENLESERNVEKVADGDGFLSSFPCTSKSTVLAEDNTVVVRDPRWGSLAALSYNPLAIAQGISSAENNTALKVVAVNKQTDDTLGNGLQKERRSRVGLVSTNVADRQRNRAKFTENASLSGYVKTTTVCEEDKENLWNGQTWDDSAGFSSKPKATGWGDINVKTTRSQVPSPNVMDTDGKWVSFESKMERVADGDGFRSAYPCPTNSTGLCKENKKSWNVSSCDESAYSENEIKTSWEDAKRSFNVPRCGDVAGSLGRPRKTGRADNLSGNLDSCYPTVVDVRTDDRRTHCLADARKGNVEVSDVIWDENIKMLLKYDLERIATIILKPPLLHGQLSLENHNLIIPKVVDKVISSIRQEKVPKTLFHVHEYVLGSTPNIVGLVNGYVNTYRRKEENRV